MIIRRLIATLCLILAGLVLPVTVADPAGAAGSCTYGYSNHAGSSGWAVGYSHGNALCKTTVIIYCTNGTYSRSVWGGTGGPTNNDPVVAARSCPSSASVLGAVGYVQGPY